MAGALNTVVPDDSYDGSADADPTIAGALSGGETPTTPPSQLGEYAKGLYDTGQRIIGSPDDPNGALSQWLKTPQRRSEAAQSQLDSIHKAMRILSAAGADKAARLPALAGYAAMLGPATSFSGSLSNYGNAYTAQIEKQQELERQTAADMANLTRAEGNVPWELVGAQEGDFQKQLNEGRTFQTGAANAQAREDSAKYATERAIQTQTLRNQGNLGVQNLRSQAQRDHDEIINSTRITAAQIAANKDRYEYIGPVSSNPNVGLYHDKTTNETKFGAASVGKTGAGGGQTMHIIEALRAENPDLSFADALSLSKRAPNNMEVLRRESLALTAAKSDLGYIGDPVGTLDKFRAKYGLPADSSAPAPAAPHAAPVTPHPAAAPAPVPAPSLGAPAPGASTLPPQARAILKEGVVTAFGNQQQWTLTNGQPVRVK